MLSTGLIICGYPGVGKTSLVREVLIETYKIIDLESSLFDLYSECDTYVKVAETLAKQGCIVMMSTHSDVVKRLSKLRDVDVVACYPSTELCSEWIKKLRDRYCKDWTEKTDKNLRAFERARDHYEDDIKFLKNCGLPTIEIDSMDYNLEAMLYHFMFGVEEVKNETTNQS